MSIQMYENSGKNCYGLKIINDFISNKKNEKKKRDYWSNLKKNENEYLNMRIKIIWIKKK